MIPIVALLKPSGEQLPAIEARGRDVVVTAGAGTGKTRTLVARYLSVLTEVDDLRSIVAITFTRKAAREMRNRVRQAIRGYLENGGPDPAEHGRWLEIYNALDAARIGTIHSLCGEILRTHPVEARIDPRFEVLEEGQTNLLQSRAIEEALARAADDREAAELFTLLGERTLRRMLTELLGKRLEAAAAFERLPADLLAHWTEALQRCDPAAELNELDRKAAHAVPLLRSVFQMALESLTALKAERQALDFADLEGRTLELLQNQAVLDHWQSTISAILVDEFQDTNHRQVELIKQLRGDPDRFPGRLFLVGDAKQSIYRFQGADVAALRHERDHIEDTGGLCVTLSTSYRAHRELVEGLNDLLRPVLGESADPDRPYVQPFEPLKHCRDQPGQGLAAPHIELHLVPGAAKDGAHDVAARYLVARIKELVESGIQLEENGASRPLAYGDVAILCRASTSFPAYENALRDAGLPFLTVAGRGFWNRPEIRDLLNTLLALSDPTDDLALVGLLRSPVIGLSDAALYRLTRARPTPSTALWDVLPDPASRDGWTPADCAAAERAAAWVSELHALVGRTAVADVLKLWLDRTDYKAALLLSGNPRSTRNVDKLLAAAFTSGIVSVGEFLEYVQGLKDSGAREGEARAAVEGAVQIMTVHQAKGLEFPIVVVGDVGHGTSNRSTLFLDDELGVALPIKGEDKEKGAVHELAQSRDRDREAAESNRLLYVACTRAREKLLISGRVGLGKNNQPTRLNEWLEALLGEDLLNLAKTPWAPNAPGQAEQRLDRTVGQTAVTCTIYWPQPGTLDELHRPAATPVAPAARPGETEAPAAPPLLGSLVKAPEKLDPRTVESERIPAQRVWRVVPEAKRPTVPAWVLGSLVHEALASWRFVGPDAADESFTRWAESRARSYGLADADQLTDAVRSTARLLRRFQAHSLYAEMNTADQLVHEVPYHLETDGRVESGIIDALYRRGEQWTLVEFKTDELRDEAALQRVLGERDYVAQSRTYVRAIERLLGSRPRAVLCFLNVAGAVRLYEPGDS